MWSCPAATAMWGETMDDSDIDTMVWPDTCAAAERMWSVVAAPILSFDQPGTARVWIFSLLSTRLFCSFSSACGAADRIWSAPRRHVTPRHTFVDRPLPRHATSHHLLQFPCAYPLSSPFSYFSPHPSSVLPPFLTDHFGSSSRLVLTDRDRERASAH